MKVKLLSNGQVMAEIAIKDEVWKAKDEQLQKILDSLYDPDQLDPFYYHPNPILEVGNLAAAHFGYEVKIEDEVPLDPKVVY